MTVDRNYPEAINKKVIKPIETIGYVKGYKMSQHKTIEEIISMFNTEVEVEETTTNDNTEVYTYLGEHYDESSSDRHWARQFASTELAVGITEAISYAVRDGLTNSDIAIVLEKILTEVKQR